MGRAPCCDKASVKKGPWSPEEDAKLKEFIDKYGTGGNWIALPQKAGLKRCGKSCRLRWLNYLRPNIKHGEFSDDEDRIICSLYASIGSRWSIIAAQLPGRTDNDIKNYWNTKLKKKLLAMLPSFPKKPSLNFPSAPLQSPPLPPLYDHHKSDQFMNTSSSSYSYNPNFLNFNTTTTFVSDLSPPPQSNTLISMISNNSYYPGFEDEHERLYNRSPAPEYYFPAVKERMVMFGGAEKSTTCSSSEGGGSCMSQISYNKDHNQIKQEEQFALQGFGDQSHTFMADHSYIDQKPKGYFKNHDNLEEMKQLIDINNNSYLLNGDDENKTTHNQNGMCYYY